MSLVPDASLRPHERVTALLLPFVSAGLLLVLWQLIVSATRIPETILPPPLVVLGEFFTSLPELANQAGPTVRESLAALALATAVGAALASCFVFSATMRDAVYPNLVLLQLIPKIAFAPLFVVWLGVDAPSRVAFATFLSFFPVALATATGLAATDIHALNLCRSLDASPWQTFVAVRVPFALSHFFAGLKVATTLVFIGVVVGEFISSNSGLGHYVILASASGATDRIFAGLIALSLCGLALYGAVAGVERLLQRWWWA